MAFKAMTGIPADTLLLILYHYLPNRAAGIAAVILYAVVSVAVTAVTIKTRTWYMMTVALTGLLELTGMASSNTGTHSHCNLRQTLGSTESMPRPNNRMPRLITCES